MNCRKQVYFQSFPKAGGVPQPTDTTNLKPPEIAEVFFLVDETLVIGRQT